MAKAEKHIDVLVIGDHPATYLAAILTAANAKLRVAHSTIPGSSETDRLVLINPEFFELSPLLAPLRRKLELKPIYGLQFLGDDGATRSEYRNKAALAFVATARSVRAAMAKLAESHDLELHTSKTLHIHAVDETGLDVHLGKERRRARALILGGQLAPPQERLLGLPDGWGTGTVHRYTFIKIPYSKVADFGSRPVVPMSLNLRETLCWGWLLPGDKCVQCAVEQPVEMLSTLPANELLSHWIDVLRRHGILNARADISLQAAEFLDLPLTGALVQEGVANRTLLVGPAGGFYSACSEDIYPNCWSALFAADAIKKALREPHLQDALQPYQQKWRTTLGHYLQGPQQNLRFLLPLVYRNQKMTTRLSESILQGKSVVR